MNTQHLFSFVLRWGVTGSLLLTAYLLIAWQTRYFGLVRGSEEDIRRNYPRATLLTGLGSLLMYLALMIVAGIQDLDRSLGGFSTVLAYNYTLYIFWLVFDTIFVDILLVTLWRPSFLWLPSPDSHGSVVYHLRMLPRGLVLGMPVTLVATGIVLIVIS